VLMGEHGFDQRAHGPTRPAVARIAYSPKAGFDLKHQPHWLGVGKADYDFAQRAGEFFFQSSRA
jgi:hypothetical protein